MMMRVMMERGKNEEGLISEIDEINRRILSFIIIIYIVPTVNFPLHFDTDLLLTAMQQSNSQNNLNFIFSSPMSSFVHPQPASSFPPAQPDDPNSPVLFKHNINVVQTQISTIRSLAHEALNAM
jgi:hypothetical protein